MAKIAQRLVAAGASPERARAFEQQYTQRLQGAQPGLTKPQDIQDAFDAEIAAFSAATYPNTFKPPTIDDPKIDAYITAIYGSNKLGQLETKAWDTKAPNFSRISRSLLNADSTKYNLDQYIVNQIQSGVPYSVLVNDIIQNKLDLSGKLTEGKIGDIVTKYYSEYNDAANEIPKIKQNLLESNKYYKVGLPDPSFKYGLATNLQEGVIDFRTHPSVARLIKESPQIKDIQDVATRRAGTTIRTKSDQDIFNSLIATGATPFSDEVKRREYLKKRTTKTGK